MAALFPVIEGGPTQDFSGVALYRYYEELIALAQEQDIKTLNDFEYFDPEFMDDLGVEMEEEQVEWHPIRDGIEAIDFLILHPSTPNDSALHEDLKDLIRILRTSESEGKGWRLEQDI